MPEINFDMDGTIADLYGNPNWLAELQAHKATPYATAKPLVNMSTLARKLNALCKQGYKINIISWLSKTSTPAFDKAVTIAKQQWLQKHLPSVHFNAINIVPYGTPKQQFCKNANDILFDDEQGNRQAWTGKAYDATQIMQVLKAL